VLPAVPRRAGCPCLYWLLRGSRLRGWITHFNARLFCTRLHTHTAVHVTGSPYLRTHICPTHGYPFGYTVLPHTPPHTRLLIYVWITPVVVGCCYVARWTLLLPRCPVTVRGCGYVITVVDWIAVPRYRSPGYGLRLPHVIPVCVTVVTPYVTFGLRVCSFPRWITRTLLPLLWFRCLFSYVHYVGFTLRLRCARLLRFTAHVCVTRVTLPFTLHPVTLLLVRLFTPVVTLPPAPLVRYPDFTPVWLYTRRLPLVYVGVRYVTLVVVDWIAGLPLLHVAWYDFDC